GLRFHPAVHRTRDRPRAMCRLAIQPRRPGPRQLAPSSIERPGCPLYGLARRSRSGFCIGHFHHRQRRFRSMASPSLVAHCGARFVEREELDTVKAPEPTDTWFPLSHSTVLDRVLTTMTEAGFKAASMKLALTRTITDFSESLTPNHRSARASAW